MATLAGAAAVATALPQRSWAGAPMLYGPSASVVKLNANENPNGPSPKALEAITKSATEGGAYYPGKVNRALAEMIAERHGRPVLDKDDRVQAVIKANLGQEEDG